MLSKCLNPHCSESFQYLGQGRLFRIDFSEADRKHATATMGNEIVAYVRRKAHPMEHFWLCERCAATMTIELSSATEVRLVQVEASGPKPAAMVKEQTAREAAAS